ncbi:MAG: hypothetical protein E7120_05015 [Bacteroidales bacterium]|nr:hypothetical protein [Bacteroidales bacterium]
MSRLCRDISAFLESEGFANSVQDIGGSAVISAKSACGDIRNILPISIISESAQDAEAYSDSLAECVKDIEGKLIIITEDRWNRQQEMMKARLLAHLERFTSLYARNCEIRRIDKPTAAAFLQACHSYGDASCRYRYGMFLKRHTGHLARSGGLPPGTLVAVAEFSNARRWIKNGQEIRSYEWTRYASLPGVRISGGMGRMLKHFINETAPDDIMSYADLEWSEGNAYEQLGFVAEGIKEPVTFTVDALWRRCPVRPGMTGGAGMADGAEVRYFRNFGSRKYRLKLTDYK